MVHFGHRRWKEKLYYLHCFGQTPFTSGRNSKPDQRVQPNVGGILPPPAMTPNLCIDRERRFDNPTCAASFPKIGIEQMDSKQKFSGPSDVQLNLQCAELISNNAYKQGTTKVSLQLLLWTLGPDRSSDEEFHATRGTSQCQMEVLQMTDKVSEKGRQVHKVIFCRGYGGHLRSKPLLTRKHWNMSASYISKLSCLAISNDLRA